MAAEAEAAREARAKVRLQQDKTAAEAEAVREAGAKVWESKRG